MLGVEPVVDYSDIHLIDDFLAPGYGQLNGPTKDAIAMAAQREALILDPVYTGKAMAGFIQRIRDSKSGRTMLFLHSGGTPAVFAYGDDLAN